MRLLINDPASLDQANHHYYQRNYQQDVNQPAGGVGSGEPQRPQYEQNNEKCPKHLSAPSLVITASTGPKRRVELNNHRGQAANHHAAEFSRRRVQNVH